MRTTKAFSTIEMLVAVALFTMVVMMSVTALTALVEANQKARTVKTAVDNLNFVIDDISRNLRLGSKYYCQSSYSNPISLAPYGANTQDCVYDFNNPGSGGQYVAYRDKTGYIALYRFNGTCIQKKMTAVLWGRTFTDDLNSGYACMTAANLILNRVRFYVQNTATYDSNQPSTFNQPQVTLGITGLAGVKQSVQTTFSIMTSMTQRIPHNAD